RSARRTRSGRGCRVSAPVYVLAQLEIRDRERYARYVAGFGAGLARYGGRLLAADETPSVLEGRWDRDKVVLLAFDEEAAFASWAASDAYAELARDRVASTEGPVLLVHGVPPRTPAPRYDAIGVGYARAR